MTETSQHANPGDGDEEQTAARVLDKLRAFIASLDDGERAVLAALLAPGVALAYADAEQEVVGFGLDRPAGWDPDRLPASLSSQIRDKGLRVEFD